MKAETENLRELDSEMHKICGWVYDSSRHAWQRNGYWCHEPNKYTEGENFQELLEQCAEKTEAFECCYIGKIGDEFVVGNGELEIEVDAKTLPLAICKFCKALHSK